MVRTLFRLSKAGIPERRQMNSCDQMQGQTFVCSHPPNSLYLHQMQSSINLPHAGNRSRRRCLKKRYRYQLYRPHMWSPLCFVDTCLRRIFHIPEVMMWIRRRSVASLSSGQRLWTGSARHFNRRYIFGSVLAWVPSSIRFRCWIFPLHTSRKPLLGVVR